MSEQGRIRIDLFTTLDGVAQAPGGPEEDTSGGFPYGGWQAPLFDETVGREVGRAIDEIDALLLGRRTYDIFAGYWPQHESGEDGEIGVKFGAVPKYVASRGEPDLSWRGSERVGDDLAAEIAAIRARHRLTAVIGSVDLVHTLLAHQLYDELCLWVYPVVLGQGKKVFPDGASPANLRLTSAPVVGESGAVLLRYAPVDLEPRTGSF
ncbi:dihydrofolate reductase family protein [Microbacterium oryzae]|uniref:dihydrofolate reductase family protein n=1 Tax=Microbacterium oryzae TaxID=743009 RepID=UPI0025B1844E|nr:dihydrofolate reductase family protein [Microbacterium oryzae]MDN3311303.1 dihydrofolate reductase family protein [Microbacterium oryzae]